MIARGVKNIKTKGMWPVRGDVLNIKGGGYVGQKRRGMGGVEFTTSGVRR